MVGRSPVHNVTSESFTYSKDDINYNCYSN